VSLSSQRFAEGQRFISQSETELGLGLVLKCEGKMLSVTFPAAKQTRTYSAANAPLKRVLFDIGDEIEIKDVGVVLISEIEFRGEIAWYGDGNNFYSESTVVSSNSMDRPEEKFLVGQFDNNAMFNLRFKTLEHKKTIESSSVRGLLGPRMSRIPHQYYVATEATRLAHPRVLLADEVGLGKTIEAGLILHKLLTSDRIERALIIVPDSLAYQWFVEMLRKFRLSFAVLNQETYLEENSRPFAEHNLVITGLGFLKGSQMARKMAQEANWDLLIVDEAHQLKWKPEQPSPEYQIVEEIAAKTPSVLLLTATPEQLGKEGHFARLRLLDPQRFFDLEKYIVQGEKFEKIGLLIKKVQQTMAQAQKGKDWPKDLSSELEDLAGQKINFDNWDEIENAVHEVVDRYGTGRMFFRNSRLKMAHEFKFFPKRQLHAYPLPLGPVSKANKSKSSKQEDYAEEQSLGPAFYAKAMWLVEFLQKNPNPKVLLICHSKAKVLELDKILRETMTNTNWSMFHSELTLLARDRQAAYFAEPEGARILLCTEIGSEGRNFAFCQNLVLFDIPQNPDLLEQRIGRLDRIGQKGNVQIHVPYIEQSWEEIFFHWYHQGLNAFEGHARSGRQVFSSMREQLVSCFNAPKNFLQKDSEELKKLLDETTKLRISFDDNLDRGRDYLVEVNSFNHKKANHLVELIKEQEGGQKLSEYMDEVFDQLGVDAEDLSQDSVYLRPGDNMFIPHFPCLTNDGVTVTFDRSKALEREDFEFLTWDHPMVTGVIETILDHQFGAVALAARLNSQGNNKGYIEAIFVITVVADKHLEMQRFLPPTPVRILMNMEGEDLSLKWSKDFIDQKIGEASIEQKKLAPKIGKEKLKKWLKSAHDLALQHATPIIKSANARIELELDEEEKRVQYLAQFNHSITEKDINTPGMTKRILQDALVHAQVRLDSFRVIL